MTDKHNDAICLTPYDPNDARYKQPMVISIGANKESANWRPDDKAPDVATLFLRLSEHREGKKDGLAFVTGDMVKGRRLKTAIKALYAVGLDIDNGTSSAQIDAALVDLGCAALRYTTHSHFKTRTEFKKDTITRFAPDEELDDEIIQRYLREKEHWDEGIVESARYVGTDHTERGIMVTVEHAPMPKHRIVIPFAEPFVIADEGTTQQAAMERWTKVPLALAEKLGVPLDKTGTDPSRLFYFPRHAANRPYEITITGGDLFNWKSLELDNPFDQIVKEVTKGTGKSKTQEGRDLGRWSMKAAHGFQIVDVIEAHAPDKIRGKASSGVDIECPFDDEHSNPGDPDDRACFAVNAGEGSTDWFTISCRHDSCREYTNLDMLGRMVKDGWFAREAIDDENFNAALAEEAPNPEAAKRIEKEDKAKEKYQQAIDDLTEESGDDTIDAAIVVCIEAGLNLRALENAQSKIAKITGTNVSTIRKMFKRATIGLRNSAEKKKREDHGLEIFSYDGEYNFDDAVKKCVRVLKKENEGAKLPLFAQTEGTPVRYEEKNNRVTFDPLTWTGLWSELNERIAFVKKGDGADRARQMVPKEVATQFHAQSRKFLSAAPEVIYAPIYLENGDLMVSPGYWPAHNLLMVDTGLHVPKVSKEPTKEEAKASVKWLLTNLLGDFPFLDIDEEGKEDRKPSKANALAYLITPFMRRMIKGHTPFFMIVKPQAGSGATFLAELGMKLYGGMKVATAPINYTSAPQEMENKIVSALREGRSHMLFDNIRELNNPVLLSSITADVVGGRVLGGSINLFKPNTFTWVATGIAPNVGGEMHRRSCWIRLNLKLPRGAKRKYRHANFNAFLEQNRGLSIHHVLTMIEYWHSQGTKEFKQRELASFEDWSRKVGGVLEVCGVKGFLDSPAPVILDPESASDDAFLRLMHDKFKDQFAGAADLFDWANASELAIAMNGKPEERLRSFMAGLGRLNGVTFVGKDKASYQLRVKRDDADGAVYGIVKVKS